MKKSKLGRVKPIGEDGIAPEILKKIDLDDIILDFGNRAL